MVRAQVQAAADREEAKVDYIVHLDAAAERGRELTESWDGREARLHREGLRLVGLLEPSAVASALRRVFLELRHGDETFENPRHAAQVAEIVAAHDVAARHWPAGPEAAA